MASWKRNLMICWLGCFTTAAGMSLVIPFLSFYIEELELALQALHSGRDLHLV